jgi:hypothetical protein
MTGMEHLRNIFEGFALFSTFGPSDKKYIHPSGGFKRDQQKLRSDVKKVGNNLKNAQRKHGKQVA